MLARLAVLSAARPRRTLFVLFAFVVLAGVVGGPIAGRLSADGGFATAASESSRADRQFERATGQETAPGIVLLVDRPDAQAATARLAAIGGVAAARPAGVSETGALVAGTIEARADRDQVAKDALAAFAEDRHVTVGGSAVSNVQIGDTVSADLGRAEMLAFPL